MAPAAPGRNGVIHVVVRAESEDDQQYEWRDKLAMTDQVQRLAESWARAHGVPGTAVGFDDEKGQEVALDATPSTLGWMPGQEVELKAFPTEDRFMEQEMEALPPGPGASLEEGRQLAGIGAAAAVGPPPVEDTLARSTAASGAKDASAKSAASKVPSPAKAASAPPPSAGATGSASSARASATEAKASARGRGGASGSGAAQPEAAKQGRGRGRGGGSPAPSPAPAAPPADPGSIPGDTEEIVFEQVNPKKEGGLAFERYEKYKRARSVSEALNLGACKGDIAHDFKRGFMKRRRQS